MIKTALQYIVGMGRPDQLSIGNRDYMTGNIIPVKPPKQSNLHIMTLTGIEDYFRENPDVINLGQAIVHVESHCKVSVFSKVDAPWIDRHNYLEANTKPPQFPFERYLSMEEFMVGLQTYFVRDEQCAALLATFGTLKQDAAVTFEDDGVSQTVTAKTGIARVGNVTVPNPVKLAPYRTFREVEQPASDFILRIKKGETGPPTAALFEADGGNWQLECVKRIRDWMRTALPEGTMILA